MGEKIYSQEDVRSYLSGTVCVYKKRPVYVEVPHGILENEVRIYYLGDVDKHYDVDYTSDDFDYRSPPLGYMNKQKNAWYVARFPHRTSKQGLASNNLDAVSVAGSRMLWGMDHLMSKEFGECIMGVYPSVEQAEANVLDGTYHSMAISRNIALSKVEKGKVGLWYKNRNVGLKDYGRYGYALKNDENSSFLRRILEKKICLQ